MSNAQRVWANLLFTKTYTMSSSLRPVAIFLAAILLHSCAPSRFTQDSGATNVLNVSLDEPGITYVEATVPVEGKSWGGVLLGAKTNYAVDASVISNNNGDKTGYTNASVGGNFLAVLTGLAECASVAATMVNLFPPDDNVNSVQPLRAIGIGAFSVIAAAAINDAVWSGSNQHRVRTQANTQIMDLTSGSHFYCMPQSQITVHPHVFSTTWEGESSLIAGTIENVTKIEGRTMVDKHQPTGLDVSDSSEEEPTFLVIEPRSLLGASGTYQRSKNNFVSFRVVSVEEEADELSGCIVTIEYQTEEGETFRKKVRASNEDLQFQSPGSK